MEKGQVKTQLAIRLIGATAASAGFYLTAFGYQIPGAALIGLGGVLIAIGGGS